MNSVDSEVAIINYYEDTARTDFQIQFFQFVSFSNKVFLKIKSLKKKKL